MKAVDNVLPPAKTAKEDWDRWQNRLQTELHTAPWYSGRRIINVTIGDDDTATIDWEPPEHDCSELDFSEWCIECLEEHHEGKVQAEEDRYRDE